MAEDLESGTVLRGKYRIARILGRGGMGKVLEAWHLDLEKRVAIKVLHSELRTNAELVERFLREGRAASKIDGDHVARILDVDRLEDGTPFLVMEYLEGSDLSLVRRTRTPLPIRDAIEYVLQASSAISQAHARGIIHRDVKPANLFLAKHQDGSVKIKVLDFGISKMAGGLGGSEPSMTQTSLVMGSAEYMSPEQMLSARDVDPRTDVWALGVVLYEILTASVPFPGESLTQVCALVMSQPAPRPRTLRPDLPESVEEIILRCLEKDRERRFATVADLAVALRAALANTNHGLGPSTSPLPALGAPPPAPIGHDQPRSLSTSVLPTTPVPFYRGPIGSPAMPPGQSVGPSASSIRAEIASSTAVSQVGAHAASPTGPQYGSSQTNAALSSDPIPAPPKKSSLWAIVGGLALLAAIGAGVGIVKFSSTSKPSTGSASSVSVATERATEQVDSPSSGVETSTPSPSTASSPTASPSTASLSAASSTPSSAAPTSTAPRPPPTSGPVVKPTSTPASTPPQQDCKEKTYIGPEGKRVRKPWCPA